MDDATEHLLSRKITKVIFTIELRIAKDVCDFSNENTKVMTMHALRRMLHNSIRQSNWGDKIGWSITSEVIPHGQ